jgi:hypothetical protein
VKTIRFVVNRTPQGASITKHVEGTEKKFKPRVVETFRKGYASFESKIDWFLHSTIDAYKNSAAIDGVEMPEIVIEGHTLSVRDPTLSECVKLIKRLVKALEEVTDATDINMESGRACKEADDLIARYDGKHINEETPAS